MAKLKTIGKTKILYVMATDAELGKNLQKCFEPLMCGVGPVESALNTALALTEFSPDLVVSLGSAGSAVLEQTGIYQTSSVAYRDMDASAFGFKKGETPFLGLPATIEVPNQIPGLPSASLSTGANVVSGEGYRGIDAQMVDMESWAILRACMVKNVPFIGMRGISDGASEVSQFEDWTRYLTVIDEKLAQAVSIMEEWIASNGLT